MIYSVKNLGQVGIIDDLPSYELPDNAFSSGQNVRFSNGKVIKQKGWQQVFSTPLNGATLTLTAMAPTVTII